MPECFFLVVDIGTESVRAALIDSLGAIVGIQSRSTDFFSPHPGWAEQRPDEWWELTIECLKQLMVEHPGIEVVAIGVSAQMHAVVPIDSRGTLLMDKVPIWCDKRSTDICQQYQKELLPKEQIQLTANLIIPSWTGPKMKWIKGNLPQVYQQTEIFLTAKDYLNFRFTGEKYTDFSEASGSFLFSWKTKQWDNELIKMFGIDKLKLPEILPSNAIIGKLLPDIAAQIGCQPAIPVICGAGDMLCLLLGGGMVREGRSCDVTGTAADVSVLSPKPLLTEHLMNLHHAIDGWISFGILDSGGGSLKWFREAFYHQEDGRKMSYAQIDDEASDVPAGADGLLFFPYLMGERLLGSPSARGSFFGLRPHHQRKHFARAVMEGVCFDLKMSLDEIEERYSGTIEEMSVIGGGAWSSLWCQLKANIYQKKVFTLAESEGGIIGAALLAFSALNGEPVDEIAEKWLKAKQVYVPDESRFDEYQKQYKNFRLFHDIFQQAYLHFGKEN